MFALSSPAKRSYAAVFSLGERILARFEFDRAFYEVLASDKFDRPQSMARITISEHQLLG
jgi:hypothetical protein